jgi:hypothetical protein
VVRSGNRALGPVDFELEASFQKRHLCLRLLSCIAQRRTAARPQSTNRYRSDRPAVD